ncbi:hypothetical protein RB595_003915 [Gaeumannomyces hyphopodioides]
MSTDVDWTIHNYRILKEKVEEYLSQIFGKPIILELAAGDHFRAQIPRELTEAYQDQTSLETAPLNVPASNEKFPMPFMIRQQMAAIHEISNVFLRFRAFAH